MSAEYYPSQMLAPSPPSLVNPHRGLSAFHVEDAHLFFGRDALTQKLWQRFLSLYDTKDATRLLATLRPAGTVKCSVAQAELLNRAAMGTLMADLGQPNKLGEFDRLSLWAANLPDISAALVVEQSKEVYTLCADQAELDAFVGQLLHATSNTARHVAVCLTLRSDFLGEAQRQHPALDRLIGEQAVLIIVMNPDELRRSIAEPAAQASAPFEDTTIDLLLTETYDTEGALPLREFALPAFGTA